MAAAESAVAQRSTLEQRSSRIAGLDSFTYGSASSREVAKCSGAFGTGQEHLLDSVSDNGLSRCLVNQQRWGVQRVEYRAAWPWDVACGAARCGSECFLFLRRQRSF